MGLARSCKSEGLVQYYCVQKCDGKMRLKNQKSDSSVGSGSGSDSKKKQHSELNGQTWSSRHQKCVETAIKRYTKRSDTQQVMEQKDSLI